LIGVTVHKAFPSFPPTKKEKEKKKTFKMLVHYAKKESKTLLQVCKVFEFEFESI